MAVPDVEMMPNLQQKLLKDFGGRPATNQLLEEACVLAALVTEQYGGERWTYLYKGDAQGNYRIYPPNVSPEEMARVDFRIGRYMNSYDDSTTELEQAVAQMIRLLPGEDPDREGLKETPKRVAKAFTEDFLSGYRDDPDTILKTFNGENYDEVVLVKDIPFYSLCEHHLVPFHGVAHVGYIPDGRVVGLSKIPRLVNCFARRLQVQERLTRQIAEALDERLHPKGVMIVMEARHMCMEARGVRTAGSSTTTSCVLGVFADPDKGARSEFLRLIR